MTAPVSVLILVPTPFEASALGGFSNVHLIGVGHGCEQRVMALLKTHKPAHVILAGSAGGLDPSLKRGDTLVVSPHEHPSTRITSADAVADTPQAKAQLYQKTGAACVEMEYKTVLECTLRFPGTRLTVLRVISDTAADTLHTDLLFAGYDLTRQKETPLRLVAYALTHPWRIPALIHFVTLIRPFPQQLAHQLKLLLEKIEAAPLQ